MRSLIGAGALLWGMAATADTLPRHDPVPGGLAVVTVTSIHNPRPQAHFGRKRLSVLPADGSWHVVIALPATILPGEYLVRINAADTKEATITFRVRPPLPGSRSGPKIVHSVAAD